jgi:hypothetical protein
MEHIMPNTQALTTEYRPQSAQSARSVFCLLSSVLCLLSPLPCLAQDNAQAQAQERIEALKQVEDVDLRVLVPKTRMNDGQRAIFEPRSVRFSARLIQMPSPQKADYLNKVLGMMGYANPPTVSQRIGIDYGGDKPLAAYVEQRAAARIAKEAKAGEEYQFYALYVYNNRFGPALVVTSFSK